MTTDRETSATNGAGGMSTRTEDLEFIAIRTFDAPRETVFKAWAECEALSRWWGPTGWTLPVCEIDFREGGTWFYCMRSPEGEDACGKTTYLDIVEPERIVYSDAFVDRDGNELPGMPETSVTVLFTEQDGKTTITSRARFATAKDLETVLEMGMTEGLTQTWDRLEAYLAAA